MRRRWGPDQVKPFQGERGDGFVAGSRKKSNSKWNDTYVWLGCLALRLLNALLVRTYFNPDEHWQALEVAHRLVFGYGHLTWEWRQGLRSYLHPLIFAALYKVLHTLRLDTPWFMTNAPRLLQGLVASFGDLYLFKFGCRIFGQRAAQWALFCQLTNWFTFFCIVRTFSNSIETVLTVVALYYWPLPLRRVPSDAENEDGATIYVPRLRLGAWRFSARQLALALGAVSCIIRPTSAIIWLYLGTVHLVGSQDKLRFLFFETLLTGVCSLGGLLLLDSWMYGRVTFVPWNFLRFNFLSAGGDFYGTHPWHWYLSQGFPVMVFSFLPLTVAGIWWSREWVLSGLLAWTLSIYSFLGHKEFRFVLPVLPLAMLFAGYALFALELAWGTSCSTVKKAHAEELPAPHPSTSDNRSNSSRVRWITIALLLTNVPVALYTSLVHQRGSEAVMEYLAEEAGKDQVESVMFLMPCHATPFYSALHKNISMRFLDCSPSDVVGYVDEADRFMDNPSGFLSALYDSEEPPPLPSHVVLFDSLLTELSSFLDSHFYKQGQRLFHSHFPVDRELQGSVLVYVRNGSTVL